MLPIRLEIKNFLAYRSPDPLLFEGIHLACLTGANGAGKSSLLDAITWALWGKARSNTAEDLIHMGQLDMYVILEFEQEGIHYKVIRRRSRKSGGGTLDLLTQQEDGSWIAQSENQPMKATQAHISRLLRMDYDTFVSSAFLQQGKADSFTTKPPRERKQILADILGLARWEDYEADAKAKIEACKGTISALESSIRDKSEEIKREPQYQAELTEATAAQQEAQAALEFAEARLEEVRHAPNELRARQGDRARITAGISGYEAERAGHENEKAHREAKIAGYQALLADRAEIEQGYHLLQTARQDDQALNQKLIQMGDLDRQSAKLEREIDAARAELEKEAATLISRINLWEETIAAAEPEALANARYAVEILLEKEKLRDGYEAEIGGFNEERVQLETTNKTLKREMDDLKARESRLKSIEGAACPFCGQPMDDDTRAHMIAEIHTEGTAKGDIWRDNRTQLETIREAVKDRQSEIETLTEELRALPGERNRVALLEKAVEDAHRADAERVEAEARLEVLRQQLEAESFALEARAQYADLERMRDQIGYDEDRHSEAQTQLAQYVAYEERQMRLKIAEESLPSELELLTFTASRIQRLSEVIAQEYAALEALDVEITRLKALVEEERIRREEMYRQRTLEANAREKVIIAEQRLKAIDDARIHKAELEARLMATREERAVYEELKVAFGKNGVPAMIIEAALPELEANANTLLARMTDGRMHMSIPTQRDKATGGVAETLDILIADELGTRGYEMFSGGEAFRINFALRVALSQMLARRAGAQLRTLFIDEGFGTQDEDGRNKLIEAITAIQDSFDLILVITHIDDLRDSFPVHIAIDKTSDGSRISVR